jgi:hypothetical protein
VRRTANGICDLSIAQFIQSVGKMFQDLFHSDNAKVSATLNALNHDSMKENKKYDKLWRSFCMSYCIQRAHIEVG